MVKTCIRGQASNKHTAMSIELTFRIVGDFIPGKPSKEEQAVSLAEQNSSVTRKWVRHSTHISYPYEGTGVQLPALPSRGEGT